MNGRAVVLPTALLAILAAGMMRPSAQSPNVPPPGQTTGRAVETAPDAAPAAGGHPHLASEPLGLVAEYLGVDISAAGVAQAVREAARLLSVESAAPGDSSLGQERTAAARLLVSFCELPFADDAPHRGELKRIGDTLSGRLGQPSLTAADRDTLQTFLRTYFDDTPQKATLDLSSIGWQMVTAKRVARHLTLRSLVVTAPDPIDSYVGWIFDPFLDALRRAVEAQHYVMDRFEIPDWTQARGTAGNARRDHETQPGLVLFRNTADDNGLLLVLLVTETPTAGLHRQAFQHAVTFVQRWAPVDVVRVVGPSFSGTVPSLLSAIEDAKRISGGTFAVTTGVATAAINRKLIGPAATFQATIHDKSTLFRTARTFLKERVLGPDETAGSRYALLKESNTAFGQAAFNPLPSEKPGAAPAEAKRPLPSEFDQALQVSFPMHISRLHAAGQQQTASSQARPFGAPSVRPLALDDGRTPTDQLPTLWPALAESAAELMVNNVLQTVAAERVRAVGIVATDPRDTLFLTQQLAQTVPNTLVYGMESDLLMTHPDFGAGTRGMVLVTTYPLYNRNQVWSYPWRGRIKREMFYSSTAEGLYNAVTLQLSASLGEAPWSGGDSLLDYATPLAPCGESCAPPVWITVVGRDGLWPVRVYPAEAGPAGEERYITAVAPGAAATGANSGFAAPMWVPGWVSGCGAALLIAILMHGMAFFWPWPTSSRPFCTFTMPTPLAAHPSGTAKYLGACFWALLIMASYIACLFWTWAVSAAHDSTGARLTLWLGTALIGSGWLLCAGAVAWLTVAFVRQERTHLARCAGGRDPARRLAQSLLRALVALVAAAALGSYAWFLMDVASTAPLSTGFTLDQVNSVLWFERSVNVLNGVSPTLPVLALALALYLWGVQGVRRRVTPQDVKLNERFLVLDAIILFEPDRRDTRRVAVARLVAVAVAMAIYLASLRSGVISFEGRPYALMYFCGALLVTMLVTVAVVSLCFQWAQVATRLRRFQDHPLLDAYRRLPDALITPRNLIQTPRLDQIYPLADRARRLATAVAWAETGRFDFTGALRRRPEFAVDEPHVSAPAPAADVWTAFSCEASGCGADTWTTSRTYQQSKLLVKSLVAELRPAWDSGPRAGVAAPAAQAGPAPAGAFQTRSAASVRVMASTEARREGAADPRVLSTADMRAIKEEIVALHLAFTLREVFAGMSGRAVFCLTSVFLLLASHTFFPFEPHRTLVSLAWLNVLVVITIGTLGLFGLERDALLRCMSGAKDGDPHGTFTLVWRVIVFAVIPLLSLLAVEFPEISMAFINWLEPMQRAL